MTNLIQMIYISRSTFAPTELTNGIEPNVARILLKSRTNNKKNGLVGVLYFGNGCFFQCLEGAAEAVDKLYETLLKDTRHKDLKVLSRKPIDALSFSNWNMKHVPLEDEMTKLLKSQGLKTFDPYNFNAEMTKNAMELLHASNDTTDGELLQDLNQQAIQPEKPLKQEAASQENHKKLIIYIVIAMVLLATFGLVLSQ
jgi:Sensors of blue-light using FAD